MVSLNASCCNQQSSNGASQNYIPIFYLQCYRNLACKRVQQLSFQMSPNVTAPNTSKYGILSAILNIVYKCVDLICLQMCPAIKFSDIIKCCICKIPLYVYCAFCHWESKYCMNIINSVIKNRNSTCKLWIVTFKTEALYYRLWFVSLITEILHEDFEFRL